MRRTFRFDKLVRDKIPDDQRSEGSDPKVRRLSDQEYLAELQAKLVEESREINEINPDDSDSSTHAAKELADLQEVLDCMADALGVSTDEIARQQAAKRDKAGSFKSRLYIETITLDESIPWIKHYLANPERYPEVKE